MRGRIWFGDLIRAVVAVTPPGELPDAATVESVRTLLGLVDRTRPRSPVQVAPVPVESPAEVPPLPLVPEGEPQPGLPEPTGDIVGAGGPDHDPGHEHLVELPWSWKDEPPARPWGNATALPQATIEQLRRPLPHLSLFPTASTSAIIQTALARRVPNGDIDVPALVDQLATGRPVDVLPRLAYPTLRFGAHVLLDRSEAMFPFHRDQQSLIDTIHDVVGAGLTEVRTFTGVPWRGRSGHRLPAHGRPVIVVSGFGIGVGGSARLEWEQFVWRLRAQQSQPVALVPFPRHRWPTWLRNLMPVVCWDRSSTVGAVRAAVGRVS